RVYGRSGLNEPGAYPRSLTGALRGWKNVGRAQRLTPSRRGDGGTADGHARQLLQFFFSRSFCTFLPISIKRRQTFSRNATTLSTSASLGSLSSPSPGFAPDGAETPGTGSPRDNSSFFIVAFSPCRRTIWVSSAERSSGTTLQAQPASLRLHCETWPVRVSSRSTPSATGLKL